MSHIAILIRIKINYKLLPSFFFDPPLLYVTAVISTIVFWALVISLIGLVYVLVIDKRFWIVVSFFAGLAALFAMIASIVRFHILGALGFFVLVVICWGILYVLYNLYQHGH